MSRNLFIAVLLVLSALAQAGHYVSPAFPPSAHQNQYYTVRYRVRGLDNPTFTFENLPEELEGSSEGVISGFAKSAGSYSIVVNYEADGVSGSQEAILKVLPDTTRTHLLQVVQTSIGLVIEYPDNLIFRVGESIRLQLSASHGHGPYVWGFYDLPAGCVGHSASGVIEGTISQEGYYNFNVEVADSQGSSAEAFMTLNVQPQAALRSSKVIDVEVAARVSYDIEAIESEQVAADNELFNALEQVDTRKTIVDDVKGVVATATLRVNKAQASLNAAEADYKNALADKESAQGRLRTAQRVLDAAQQNLELALIEQGQASARLTEAREAVDEAQERFDNAEADVEAAEDALVEAKASFSECEAELRAAETERDAAQLEFGRAFEDLENARAQLEDARARKELADQAVKAAQDALDLAQQARDDAEADLVKADFALENAENALDQALARVAEVRERALAAQQELSAAQWEWEQAVNKLYVAQARKEAADRASAIALAEGSRSDHNSVGGGSSTVGNSGSIQFNGCQAGNYPAISGTSQVVHVGSNGYRLASGHEVVYGGCSQVANCAVGDFATYNGYIVNGVVNALRIERVLLS